MAGREVEHACTRRNERCVAFDPGRRLKLMMIRPRRAFARLRHRAFLPVAARPGRAGAATRVVSSAASSASQRRNATTSGRSATRGAASAKYDEAAWLLDRLVSNDDFADFLTEPAYELVSALPAIPEVAAVAA